MVLPKIGCHKIFEQFFPTCSLEISEKQPRRLNFFFDLAISGS